MRKMSKFSPVEKGIGLAFFVWAFLFVAQFVVIGFVITALCVGNFWFSKEKLQDIVSIEYPGYNVQRVERNIFSYGKAIVVNKDGERETFLVDSNILQNVSIKKGE